MNEPNKFQSIHLWQTEREVRREQERNGGLSVENKNCESCVYFDKNTDNQTGMCREFECCVNKNQCCQWYVKRLDK